MNSPHLTHELPRPAGAPATVLFIGDRLGPLKQIGFAMQHAGHSVLWTESGRTGLEFVECEQPDLVICEVNVPDLSGIEICREIRTTSSRFDVPVILICAPGNERRDLPRAFAAGADEFYVSFVDRPLILAKIEWLLRKRRYRIDRTRYDRFIEDRFYCK